MTRVLALLLVALAFVSAPAATQPAPRAQVCAPTNAQAASVAAIAADPAAWLGKCVSVEAIYSGERLNADLDAIYGVNGNSIGGYVDGQGDVGGAWRGTFTGRVADCAQAEEDLLTGLLRSPGISINGRTLGCLEPKGPFLVFMSQGELKDAGLKRRLPGAKGGDLGAPPAGWEHAAAVEDVASRFLEALTADGDVSMKALLGNGYVAAELRAREDTAFAKLKQTRAPKLQVFAYPASSPDKMAAEACFCTKADCAKLWPIAGRDADNQAGRPYACIRIDGRREGERWSYQIGRAHV